MDTTRAGTQTPIHGKEMIDGEKIDGKGNEQGAPEEEIQGAIEKTGLNMVEGTNKTGEIDHPMIQIAGAQAIGEERTMRRKLGLTEQGALSEPMIIEAGGLGMKREMKGMM